MSLLGMSVETLDSEAILARFNKLVSDLLRGTMNRNTFQPWEIEILLDIESCNLERRRRARNAAPLSEGRPAFDGKGRADAAPALGIPQQQENCCGR